jgi:hypothetical protein
MTSKVHAWLSHLSLHDKDKIDDTHGSVFNQENNDEIIVNLLISLKEI